MDFDLIKELAQPADSKIVFLVLDGLGGLPRQPGGETALEAARTPHLDRLAAEGICGLHEPIGTGIIPGSGPAHQALFGYEPVRYRVGRGALSALGVDFDLQPEDVAARGNFATLDDQGRVTDRRAGRIPTEKNQQLLDLLKDIQLPGAELFLKTEKEHRLLFVLRGAGLSGEISDTDPQQTGVPLLQPQPLVEGAGRTAELVQQFLAEAHQRLEGQQPANGILLRGFSQRPDWPTFPEVFGLRAVAIAGYPMYRGVAKLIGMEALPASDDLEAEFSVLEQHWETYDFFFVHVKGTDSAGEDGDFDRKKSVIEQVDGFLPRLMDLNPDVVVVTGDHSTPTVMKAHGWQPVPVLLWSQLCRADPVERFGERACMGGGLGPRFPAVDLMVLAMANAGRLKKFGA